MNCSVGASKSGVVIDVQVFTRDSVEKDARAKSIDENRLAKIRKDIDDEFGIQYFIPNLCNAYFPSLLP
jgi:hypothetical protein